MTRSLHEHDAAAQHDGQYCNAENHDECIKNYARQHDAWCFWKLLYHAEIKPINASIQNSAYETLTEACSHLFLNEAIDKKSSLLIV